MLVGVNSMACQGHGVCVGIEPQVFAFTDEEGRRAYATMSTVPDELVETVREAARSCPASAIIVVE